APPGPGHDELMSGRAAFHPLMAVKVVLGMTPAPVYGAVVHYGFPRSLWLAYPQYSYIAMTLLGSLFLVILSLFFVRRGAKEGEDTLGSRLTKLLPFGGRKKDERQPRHVWQNPIAWREAVTSAAAGGGGFVRYG